MTPEVAELRKLVNEPTENGGYTDELLLEYISAAFGDPARAAITIWEEKAAKYAELVNVSEAGSSRSLGDLHKNALEMADAIRKSRTTDNRRSGARTRQVTRP